ncbi:hypothetical protein LPB03_13520 [Polaribacter vadi]|uniref:Uncharacterized protein n=1 Tax=Polaribacter vadi TaxID=1774273 RepID=A0A1B8U2A7_9FLAO|nr:hypothetical protein [Polaribacter vadi]AOW18410.1 hypothetical protein LPB03_13520 [Polaribacter vadi]OBY66017.1 hypothetical protein LPB3_02050 [Polaribacter vadi]
MTLSDYINEIEFAASNVLEAIWTDNKRAEKLKTEIEQEAKIVENEYQRAIALQNYAEDPDDVMLGVGMYWDNYFGADKDVYHKNEKLTDLQQRLTAHEFSIISLCGNLLEHAKKGLSIVYGNPKKWPCGRKIGNQCLSEIIIQSRNQSAHIDEAIKKGKFRNNKIDNCFELLKNDINEIFSDYTKRDMAFEIIKILGWTDFNSFKTDLELLV